MTTPEDIDHLQSHSAVLEKLLHECYPFVVHAALTIPDEYPAGRNARYLLEVLKPIVRAHVDRVVAEHLKKDLKNA